MTINEPTFGTTENAANVTRNFAPIGIMAMGMTVVIITGGIDLSVGSVMGLVAIVAGLLLTW
ncbi:MAG: ABC transporter permease, partial [Alphaproteobacteria bacterium]